MITEHRKLENPIWHSLTEVHQSFAIDYGNIKFYHPDYCPFGGYILNENIAEPIDKYSTKVDQFFIVGEKPGISNSMKLKNELVCDQMILNKKITFNSSEHIVRLNDNHAAEVFQLVNMVQPGYFKSKTFLLGSFFGIFKNDKLISITGERMKMNEYTEVSAVITHPDHTGKGYARQLVAHTANNILEQKKTPFLHVAETNIPAIRLYNSSGFTKRRKISFWNFTK
ncbi:MAG TPA: GNAT family N-acetyltransferase [Chitinophagaceae bacterium]|nr:GNAT family N-acetyltransferase [Chitinophagaceae bacterium]